MYVAIVLLVTVVSHVAGFELFPFGPSAGDSDLGPNDDNADLLTLNTTFCVYGDDVSIVRIYNNGYLSLCANKTGSFNPEIFPRKDAPRVIAPYWADADATVGPGRTYYRETDNKTLLKEASILVGKALHSSFNPISLLIVTWDRLGYHERHQDKLNTFQLMVATDGYITVVGFLYENIQWTTGDASGGTNGFGGTMARAGLDAGDGLRHVTIPVSGTPQVVDIDELSNVGIAGLFMYRTEGDTIDAEPLTFFYPHGIDAGDATLNPGYNVFKGIKLQTPVWFYGQSHYNLIVWENGYITLGTYGGAICPSASFPFPRVPLIAPFWADVDGGQIYYRETKDHNLLDRASREVAQVYAGTFVPEALVVVTWSRVGFAGYNPENKSNTFQVVIATERYSGRSFVLFLYSQLEWTTSDTCGGHNGERGNYGWIAKAGINVGDGYSSTTIMGSGTSKILQVVASSNAGVPGLWVMSIGGTGELYPFGNATSDYSLPPNDDDHVHTEFELNLYGKTYNKVFVHNNGYLTLKDVEGDYTPVSFPFLGNPIIAPFWADVDTRVGDGSVYYRATNSKALLQRVEFEVAAIWRSFFKPTRLLIVTWDHVGYYDQNQDKLNTYQCVLASDDQQHSYAIFLYNDIQWTTGDASGGDNGFNGTAAVIGYNIGDGKAHITSWLSGTNKSLELPSDSNTRMPGLFAYSIHSVFRPRTQPYGTLLKDYRTTLTDELGYYPTKDDKRINKQETFKELEVLAEQGGQGGWDEGAWETEYESTNAAKEQLESTEQQGTDIENLINELKALSEHSESYGRPAKQNEVGVKETAPTSQWNQPLMIPQRDGKTYYNNYADNGRAEWSQEQVPSLMIPQREGKTYDGFNNIHLDNGRAEWNQEEQVPPSMNYNRGNIIYVETSPNWK